MKLTKYFLTATLALTSLHVIPQASLDSLLSAVLQNNRSIIGSAQYLENKRIASRTNLYPENPEVEFGHMWSSTSEVGNRTDFTLSQTFDFPRVYVNRSKLSKAGVEKASQTVQGVRQETLLGAKQLWVEKVYLNRKKNVLQERMEQAEAVDNYLQKQFENGEISKLRYNKALLLKASLRAELDLLEAESATIDTEISRVAGVSAPEIKDTLYYATDRAILDSVLAISTADPLYLAVKQEMEMLNLQKQLTRSLTMPKLKTGYYSESLPNLQMRGVLVGLSIPLWENANKVKAAEAEIISAELAADKYRSDQVSGIMQTHIRYKSYKKQSTELASALELSNDPALLNLAMESGEISLVEFYYETDLYYSVLGELLLAEKEMYLAESELSKYEL
jgi:cobalt-zinc-cadmium efflux system outer membrane protein